MASQINLADTLSALEESSGKLRTDLLEDLKHVLRHNSENHSLEPLNDAAFQHIFETVIKVTTSDRTSYLSAKTQALQKTTANRLSSSASTLRSVIGISVRTIKSKTVRFVLSHLLSNITTTNGFLCEPLAVDYAKSIKLLLGHRPHVEHIQHATWEDAVTICLRLTKDAQDGMMESDDEQSALNRSTSNLRPRARQRTFQLHVANEMMGCLLHLSTACNVTLDTTSKDFLRTAIHFLDTDVASSNSNEEAFGVINNVVMWAMTENVELLKSTTSILLKLVRKYWQLKLPSLKVELVVLLVHIQPFVALMKHQDTSDAGTLRNEVKALYDAVLQDYTRKPERDQMQQSDVTLHTRGRGKTDKSLIRTSIFTLRSTRAGAEHNWAVLTLLAQWAALLSVEQSHERDSGEDAEATRSRKRTRLTLELDELQTTINQDFASTRIVALQIVTFVGQSCELGCRRRGVLLAAISRCCNEENTSLASWAFLAAGSLATQHRSTHTGHDGMLNDIWQAALRAISNTGVCRAACHFMQVMLHLNVPTLSTTTDLIQHLTASLDLTGPAILADASIGLLRQVLLVARASLPGILRTLSQRIMAWFAKKWTPSKLETRSSVPSTDLYDTAAICQLVWCAMDNDLPDTSAQVLECGAIGSALLHSSLHSNVLDYLLLHDGLAETVVTMQDLSQPSRGDPTSPDIATQAILLNHLLDEIPQLIETFRASFAAHPQNLTTEACRLFCTACYFANLVAHDLNFADTRRVQHLQAHCATLLQEIEACSSKPECRQEIVDTILRISVRVLYKGSIPDDLRLAIGSSGAAVVAKSLLRILSTRQQHEDSLISQDFGRQSTFASDPYESQESRKSTQAPAGLLDLATVSSEHSTHALRCTISIHALILGHLDTKQIDDEMQSLSHRISEHLMSSSSIPSTMQMLHVLGKDLTRTLKFEPADVEQILTLLSGQIISSYTYSRSSQALSSVIDFMIRTVLQWTDTSNSSLSNLGLDIYEWFINLTVVNQVSPAAVQRKIADMLLAVCRQDPDFGSQAIDMSARTSLFKLLHDGPIGLQFYLAPRLSEIFSLYSVSTHDQIFDDLQKSLSVEVTWLESIAMRLYILAELGSTWHSLLRWCVYYIFETAGQVPSAVFYAKRCIARLASSLSLDSPVKLFTLFRPQLLHTWLDGHTVQDLPFAVFGYTSIEMFLSDNQEEIAAQLFLRELQEDLSFVAKTLNEDVPSLLSRTIDKTLAYAIGKDTTIVSSASKQTLTCENRLREVIGKQQLKSLVYSNYGAIIGRIFLAIDREESDEKWLEKGDSYSSAANALAEMKNYSQSTRPLPPSQEPHFTSKYLLQQLERLARRVGHSTMDGLWNASSYTLASQMLFDSIDNALGSIHSCAVIQKLRLLIALAKDTSTAGYPLEHTLRLLLPFLEDQQCADDVIGILRYLLSNSVAYLSEHWTTLWSVSIHIVLRLTKLDTISQQTPTQTSQQRETLLKMQRFRAWLLAYLENTSSTLPAELQEDAHNVSKALGSSTLPGNARAGSPESVLMLYFLKQNHSSESLLHAEDVREAMKLLANGFEVPDSHAEDCLRDDDQAQSHAQSLWLASQDPGMDSGFVLWAALVAGRVFAATGSTELFTVPVAHMRSKPATKGPSTERSSQQIIADQLQALLRSSQAQVVSIGLSTMRACMLSMKSEFDRLAFQKLFAANLVDATADARSSYYKTSIAMAPVPVDREEYLRDALAVDSSIGIDPWTTRVAIAICNMPRGPSYLSGLPLLLNNDSHAARTLLPSIAHLVLCEDNDISAFLREALSGSLEAHLSSTDPSLATKQHLLIEMLMYLQNQAYPGETTQVDRIKWLDCDLTIAADCAVRCRMPTTALMLAEMGRTTTPIKKRASSRASLAFQTESPIPNELLLSIFKQVSEPDSYYGVEQPASLQSFLERSEYEGNALQTLISRSAQIDNNVRTTHELDIADTSNMMRSLSGLNLDSLTYAVAQANPTKTGTSAGVMLDTARVLQQWDISVPEQEKSEGVSLYRAFHVLNHATSHASYIVSLKDLVLAHAKQYDSRSRLSLRWTSALAAMTDIMRIATDSEAMGSSRLCDLLHESNTWMELGEFDSIQTLVRSRSTIAGVLFGNKSMLESLHLSTPQIKQHEAKSLIMLSKLARKHDRKELAMSAAWQLSSLAEMNPDITGVAQREIASVLASVGESAASVKLLREVSKTNTTSAGQAGLLSQIGQQLAVARLEAPSEILQTYLKPSIEQLQSQTGAEAGEVFYTFAAFCDAQLQSASALVDFQRLTKLRQAKLDETVQLRAHVASMKRNEPEYKVQKRNFERALQWYEIDNAEYIKVRNNRELFAEQSLKNYMHTLRASNKYDLCVLRLFALWLEYSESKQTQATVSKHLPQVPTWKFVLLMNQLMSRLKGDRTEFDKALLSLLQSVCRDHPYHTVHHLYAARKFPGEDQASQLRRNAAERLCHELVKMKPNGEMLRSMLKTDSLYRTLAQEPRDGKNNGQYALDQSVTATKISRLVPKEQIPSATLDIALQPDGVYTDVPTVTGFGNTLTIMTGLSAPKVLTVFSSDGKQCKQLFKGGNDDLRQDAIMEQVFEEVSKMLRTHKAARQRNLQVRTYKVIPLTNHAGIIEFVPNSIPINDFLQPAHQKYYPSSMKVHTARQKISAVADQSTETRVKEFRKVCEQMPPVLRHFFFERFRDPDEWFTKRTAYTRTTAAISILGQILGLGDRHCHNILLDGQSGEVIHIDLGVAFEAGRVLPIPELVPFRLTRDIIDGMGVTGTEGIFKRCAEFTLDALRKNKDGIMTLLNVLRYDPLYSWTLSPVKAKRMQQQEGETNGTSVNDALMASKTESEAGEAERALSIVEKKLGNALSTAASVSELIQQATDDRNLATLFSGWAAFF